MTSNGPRDCCYQGVRHEGTATGRIETIDDFEIYISEPADASNKFGILFLSDIIGHKFNNAQLIADQFAKNGYFVLMPDLFYGDAVPFNKVGELDIPKWLQGEYSASKVPHTPSSVDPIVEKCLSTMRGKYGCHRIGAVGYCFGAKYVVRYLSQNSGKIDVGYVAHPSFVQKEELEVIQGPLAIAAAETDEIFPEEKRHESEEILAKLNFPYQLNLYSGVTHGFAVRCDLGVKQQRYAKESAFLQALEWFQEYLKTE